MAPRTVYANLTDGLQPFSLWDQSLADVGNLGMIPCTAAGTNSIVLTPIAAAFAPTIATPQQLQNFTFVAAGNSSGPVTIQIGTAAALKLYRMDGVTQATTGDLVSAVSYGVVYNSALNGAAGGFQLAFPISNEINPIISGATISGSTITTSTYNGNTWTAGTGILTIAAAKTLTANNSLTLAGTDGTTMTFPTTSATLARTDAANTFTGTQTVGALVATTVNGNTVTAGTGILTLAAGKTLSASNSLTLAGTDATTITFQATDTYVGRTTTDTLTNKTFDTAGTGNVFKINGTGVSAVNGTGAVSLTTNAVFVTPTLGAATATSVTFSPTTGGIVGTTTNDSASAGTVGEYVESILVSGSAVSLVTATAKDVTTISLTAGDWDVDAIVYYTAGATTTVNTFSGYFSLTLNTVDTTPGRIMQIAGTNMVPNTGTQMSCPIPPYRFSLSGTTTIHLGALSIFATSTLSAFGIIRARRVR